MRLWKARHQTPTPKPKPDGRLRRRLRLSAGRWRRDRARIEAVVESFAGAKRVRLQVMMAPVADSSARYSRTFAIGTPVSFASSESSR